MSKIVQWKRGNTTVSSTYTGFEGEITVDTDNWTLYVHDGVTTGGHLIGSQPANIANIGNLSIIDQTISGTIENANIVIQPNNGSIRANSQFFSVGADASLLLNKFNGSNVALITTANRGNGNIGLRLSASSSIGIDISPVNGHIGFLTIANPGYTGTINGSFAAQEFYASANLPTGYQFTTPDGDTGFSHAYQDDINGNISLVRIKHGGLDTAKFYDNLTTTLSGNLVISQNNAFGLFPNAFIQTYSDVNFYSQLISQNLSDGSFATTDIVVTADAGTDFTDYLDLGIAGSGYNNTSPFNSLGTSIDRRDGYIYVQGNANSVVGGNLTIGTTLAGKVTKILSGGIDAANVVAIFSEAGVESTGNIQAANFLGNMPYTMANASQWTTPVTTVAQALDQLAARIWAIEHP
jgi:hypothetical protein